MWSRSLEVLNPYKALGETADKTKLKTEAEIRERIQSLQQDLNAALKDFMPDHVVLGYIEQINTLLWVLNEEEAYLQ